VLARRGVQARCAFSLIELLVTLGIITILMSILLPALKRSVRQASATVCMHNLRAVAQVEQMYRMDNAGWLPVPTNAPDGTPLEPWFAALFPRYLNDLRVLICPDDPYRLMIEDWIRSHPSTASVGAASYGMSEFILSSPDAYLANLDRHAPRRPTDTLLAADMGPDAYVGVGVPPPMALERNAGRLPWGDQFDYGAPASSQSWVTQRHGISINVLTLSGEVRPVRTNKLLREAITDYYPQCAAGDCTFCLHLNVEHYSFAHARTFWWTGPVPAR